MHLENPDALLSMSHDCWTEEKLNTGWKYGPVEDLNKKEHFEKLPQVKDFYLKQLNSRGYNGNHCIKSRTYQ